MAELPCKSDGIPNAIIFQQLHDCESSALKAELFPQVVLVSAWRMIGVGYRTPPSGQARVLIIPGLYGAVQ